MSFTSLSIFCSLLFCYLSLVPTFESSQTFQRNLPLETIPLELDNIDFWELDEEESRVKRQPSTPSANSTVTNSTPTTARPAPAPTPSPFAGCLPTFTNSSDYMVMKAIQTEMVGVARIGAPNCIINTNIVNSVALAYSAIGTIPRVLYNLTSPLSLIITGPVSGTLPTEITRWTQLGVFGTQSAGLSGTIPSEYGLLPLTQFVLQLPFIQASGTIPSEFNSRKTLSSIDITGNLFSGSFPIQLFSNATKSVYIGSNLFTGTLPTEISALSPNLSSFSIELTPFSGTIPTEFGRLPSLVNFQLDRAPLSGILPSELGNNPLTRSFNLYNLNLTGTIPTEYGKMRNCLLFNVFNNQLTGTLPSELGNMMNLAPNLTSSFSFDVSNNQLTGTIPTEYSNWSRIQFLGFTWNKLSGTFPSQFVNNTALTTLLLANNQLTGSLPAGFNLLTDLYISVNKWNTSVWDSIMTYANLTTVSMELSGLMGSIPVAIGSRLPLLQKLYLSYNQLTGTVPLSVSGMTAFRLLDVSGNRMSFPSMAWVPAGKKGFELDVSDNNLTSIGNLNYFGSYSVSIKASKNKLQLQNAYAWMINPGSEEIDFSDNGFSGVIPFQIIGAYGQRLIDLSGNKLSGTIPSEFFNNFVSLQSLDLSDNAYTGTLPSQLFYHSIKNINLASNNLTQDVTTFPRDGRPSQSLLISKNNFYGDFKSTVFATPGSFIKIDNNNIQCIGLPTWCAGGVYFPDGTGACYPCKQACGDGLRWDGEDCDDGNTINGDGCSSSCLIESGFNCYSAPVNSSVRYIVANPSVCTQPDSGTSTAVIVVSVVIPIVCLCILLLLLLFFLRNLREKNNFINKLTKKLQLKSAYVILEEELSMDKVLGEGNFGKVYLGYLNQTTQVAIKEVKHQSVKDDGFQDFITEAKLVSSIPPHPNIVQFMGVCISESKQTIYIVTQYIPNKNLQNFLRHNAETIFTEKQIELCVGVAAGMGHLAKFGIIHNDLAARNILVEEVIIRNEAGADNQLVAKVADFGLANSKHSRMTQSQTLPVRWTAPEVLLEPEHRSVHSDVWSFGVVMYEIMTKCKNIPYHGMNNAKVYQTVVKSQQVLECPPGCPEDVYQVMASCWRHDAAQRPAFSKLHSVLTQIFQFYSSKSGNKTATTNFASTLTSTMDMTSGKETEYWNTLGGNLEDDEEKYLKGSTMETF